MADPLGVYFLDVGQGDCSFVVPPKAAGAVLFDCNDAHVAERFVEDHGITHLSAAVVSHLDVDHIRGMLAFLKNFLASGCKVDALYIGLDKPPAARLENEACTALLEQAFAWSDAGTLAIYGPFRQAEPAVVCTGNGWSVGVVLPHYGQHLRELIDGEHANRSSAVLRVLYGGTAVLIGGDAPLSSWSRLDDQLVPAQVIRTPHHGGEIRDEGAEHDFADLYERVAADVAVISVGTTNSYSHPLEEHVDAAERGGKCRILCTQLTPRCHARPEARRKQGLARTGEVVYAYRHHVNSTGRGQEAPCAGSIAVAVDSTGEVTVAPARFGWHDAFVAGLDDPMCGTT